MTTNLIRYTFVASLLFYSISCKDNRLPFDKTGWNVPCDGIPSPELRDKMLDDLLENHKIKGLTYQQIISKLEDVDNHERTPSNIMRYEITTEYTMGEILHIKALDLHFDKDSIIISWEIVNYDVDM